MHLALLTPEWWYDTNPGGIATYCQIFARQAGDLGHDVTVFALRYVSGNGTAPAPTTLTDRVRVVTVPIGPSTPWGRAEAFRDAVDSWIAQGHRIDCAEAADYWGVGALLDRSVPLVTRLHTPYTHLLDRSGIAWTLPDRELLRLEEIQVRASILSTSPSEWMADEAVRLWDLTERPTVIANPIDTVATVADLAPDSTRPLQVLYFGRLENRKGVFTLAQALRSWFDQGADAEVSFVSQETAWKALAEAQMRQILGRHAEPPRCRFLPEQRGEQLQRTIAAADLVVLPSRDEAFGYTVVEAMAHAKPVISSTGSGPAEIIAHGRTGFLVPPGDAAALAATLARVSTDRAALREIGRRARKSLARYSSRHTTARLLDLYTRVIDGRDTTPASRTTS